MEILKYCVMGYVAYSAVGFLRDKPLRESSYELLPTLRWKHFRTALGTIALTAPTGYLLTRLPVLDWGWTDLLDEGGSVTAIGATGDGQMQTVQILVFGLILAALPVAAHLEEKMFRSGAERRTRAANINRAVVFGLFHLLVGVPLGVALALGIAGWVFTRVYLKEYRRVLSETWSSKYLENANVGLEVLQDVQQAAVKEATRVHLAHNLVIFVPLTVLLTIAVLG